MDPFEQEEDIKPINNVVTISTQSIGKRTVTFISGLPYDKETMKQHLSTLKKKNGCSGSLKDEKKIKDKKDNEKKITSNLAVDDNDDDNKNDNIMIMIIVTIIIINACCFYFVFTVSTTIGFCII